MVPNVNYLKFKVAKKDKQKFTRTIFHEHVLKKKCYDQPVDFDRKRYFLGILYIAGIISLYP
jgi:hypothetical protein